MRNDKIRQIIYDTRAHNSNLDALELINYILFLEKLISDVDFCISQTVDDKDFYNAFFERTYGCDHS